MLTRLISRMREHRYQAVLILVCMLSACSSAPPQANKPSLFYPPGQAYWMNPFWQAELFSAVQCVVHLPANSVSPATSRVQGTVKFLFEDGTVKEPVIVKSTGNPELDKLMLQQVVTAKVPKPFGLHTDQPYEFELPLEMFTPYESFQYNVYAAINRKQEYPRDPLLQDIMGITTVDFDYLDAKVSHIAVIKSSGNEKLDQVSLNAVSRAVMPPPSPGYASKTLHMVAIFCYSINYAEKCPTGENVIGVYGTRVLRRTVVTY